MRFKIKTSGFGIKKRWKLFTDRWTKPRKGRFIGHYDVWRSNRIAAIVEKYGAHFWMGKTVLEVGAGYGDIGSCFALLGARVVCYEGRDENTNAIKSRFDGILEAETVDCDGVLPGGPWEVIIHLGVLYHLQNAELALRSACQKCENLILETECSDSDDPNFILTVKEDTFAFDQSMHGKGTRPSPAWVERILKEEGFSFERITDARCNGDLHRYDWPIQNTKEWRHGLRGMWFARKER